MLVVYVVIKITNEIMPTTKYKNSFISFIPVPFSTKKPKRNAITQSTIIKKK